MKHLNSLIIARSRQGLLPYSVEFTGRPDIRILKWSTTQDSQRALTIEKKVFGINRLPRMVGSHILTGLFGIHSFDVINTIPAIAIATPEREMYAFRATSAEQLNALGAMITREVNYSEFMPDDLVAQKFPKFPK